MKPRIIAFYLPQFHPMKENDEWWGKGFTEWTNVGKAKPLFKGHNQPRVPTELGYYDLRMPEVREQQAQLAREAGVEAFCYWHYWFGNGKQLMQDIFNDVLESGHPDFPFCLGWANHSWYNKTWNPDGTSTNKLLLEQTYPGIEDEKMHFAFFLKAFKDKRYVKVNGAPLLYIFETTKIPDDYLIHLRQWTKEAGFPDLYLVGNIPGDNLDVKPHCPEAYNAFTIIRQAGTVKSEFFRKHHSGLPFFVHRVFANIRTRIFHLPRVVEDYKKFIPYMVTEHEKDIKSIPCIIPQWDHTPRSGLNGTLFVNTSPKLFYEVAMRAFNMIKKKPAQEQLVILKSWNEWGEGNFMEPDLAFGRGFIDALGKAVRDVAKW